MKVGNPAEKPVAVNPATTPAVTAEASAKAGASAAGVPAPAAGATPTAVSAKVELSSTAATLLATGGSAEFDASKVQRISQAISNGTFKINPEVIADKLIANAQELLTKAQR